MKLSILIVGRCIQHGLLVSFEDKQKKLIAMGYMPTSPKHINIFCFCELLRCSLESVHQKVRLGLHSFCPPNSWTYHHGSTPGSRALRPSCNQTLTMQQVAVHLKNCKRRIHITCFQPSLLQSAILGVPYSNYVLL